MKKTKKIMAFLTAAVMMASNLAPAFASGPEYSTNSEKYLNKLEIKPAKPELGKTATDLIENPQQPAIYTLRTNFSVPVEGNYKNSYQPYIASVGAAASPQEKAKVNKTMPMPKLAGFTPPNDKENFTIDYNTVKNGDRTTKEFRYEEVNKTIQVNDVFQDINDLNNYIPRDVVHKRTQTGSTGSALQVQALQADQIKGFVPEKGSITVQLPDDTEGYVVQYRYNRAHYDVTFETGNGTPVEARSFFYGQKIPSLGQDELPTQDLSLIHI